MGGSGVWGPPSTRATQPGPAPGLGASPTDAALPLCTSDLPEAPANTVTWGVRLQHVDLGDTSMQALADPCITDGQMEARVLWLPQVMWRASEGPRQGLPALRGAAQRQEQ